MTGLRIAAQIINVSDGSILWGDKYDGEEKEIFDIQDQIAQEVVDNLEIELRGGEKAGLVKRYTENIEAYNTYLKGRWFWDKRKEEDLEKAVNFFKEAIMKDTNYALAYAGLADCYIALSDYGSMPIQEAWVKGKNAALTALEIDDTLAEAHTSLGMIKTYYDWDWEGAEREFRRAIELNQNYATARHWYALYLMMMLRFDEAIEEIRQALKLDPLSLAINRNIGLVFYTASKYDKAIEASQRTLEMGPDYVYTRLILGLSYSQKSMYMEALEELEREKYKGQFYLAFAGFAYAEMGKINKAQKLLEELLETSEGQLIRPSVFACLYFVIGEKDQSFKWMEKAHKDHDNYLLYIRIFPASRNLAFDPLFKELLKKMGLA